MEIVTKDRRKENQVIWYFISLYQFSIKLHLMIVPALKREGVRAEIY